MEPAAIIQNNVGPYHVYVQMEIIWDITFRGMRRNQGAVKSNAFQEGSDAMNV